MTDKSKPAAKKAKPQPETDPESGVEEPAPPKAAKKPASKPKAKAKGDEDEDAKGAADPGPEFLVVEDEDGLDTTLIPTDTSERYILVVDEEGHRRNETVAIISKILPNAIIEVADDPEEAQEMMSDCEFDTYVVNFLMPGYSASPFVKAVANHPDHPLLIGFAADKISDALDPKKGLKIIPLKRLFDLDTSSNPDGEGD